MNQVFNGANFQAVLLRKLFQVGAPRHAAILVHNFHNHRGGFQPRQARQIATCLGVAGAGEHATGLGHQRKNVAGLHNVARLRTGGYRGLHGAGAILGGNAGGDAFGGFNRHSKVGAVRGIVVVHHTAQVQLLAALACERQANQAARVGGHEVDILGPHQAGGHHQVALVLAVFVVQQNDHAAIGNVLN